MPDKQLPRQEQEKIDRAVEEIYGMAESIGRIAAEKLIQSKGISQSQFERNFYEVTSERQKIRVDFDESDMLEKARDVWKRHDIPKVLWIKNRDKILSSEEFKGKYERGYRDRVAEESVMRAESVGFLYADLTEIPSNYLEVLKKRTEEKKPIRYIGIGGNDIRDISFLRDVDFRTAGGLSQKTDNVNLPPAKFYRVMFTNQEPFFKMASKDNVRESINAYNECSSYMDNVMTDDWDVIPPNSPAESYVTEQIASNPSCKKAYAVLNPSKDDIMAKIDAGGIDDDTYLAALVRLDCHDLQRLELSKGRMSTSADKKRFGEIAASVEKKCKVKIGRNKSILL